MVLNDFGELGRALLETDELEADDWTTVRVVAFNIAGLATQGGGCG